MQYPNLFIVGLPKAGTTSLHDMLVQHNDIHGNSDFKDYLFYNEEQKIEELSKLAEGYQNEKYLLDTGATYAFFPTTIARIKETSPGSKLILLVRNPVERTLSDFYFRRKYGRIKLTEEDVLESEDKPKTLGAIFELSMFGKQLSNLYQFFSKEQVLVLLFEDLITAKDQSLHTVFKFLDIAPSTISLSHKNKTGASRIPLLTRLVRGRSTIKKVLAPLLPKRLRKKLAGVIVDLNRVYPEIKATSRL